MGESVRIGKSQSVFEILAARTTGWLAVLTCRLSSRIPEERIRPSVSIPDLNGAQRLIGPGSNDSNSRVSRTTVPVPLPHPNTLVAQQSCCDSFIVTFPPSSLATTSRMPREILLLFFFFLLKQPICYISRATGRFKTIADGKTRRRHQLAQLQANYNRSFLLIHGR